MNLSSSEISSILKEQIEKFDLDVKTEEIGKVLSVGDGIASCLLYTSPSPRD